MIKNQLKKDFQWMGLATIIQSICYAIQVILMVRYWGGAGFGLAMTALIPYRIFIIAIDALLSGAIVKNETLSEANKNILFSFCLILGVFCAAFCWIIPYISQIFGGESVWRLYSHGALIPLVIALSIPGQAYFQREFNFKAIGLGEMAGSLISTLIFVVMLFSNGPIAQRVSAHRSVGRHAMHTET